MYQKGTANELANELGVSRQTVYRKLKKLSNDISFPIKTENEFNIVVYAIQNNIRVSEVQDYKANNISKRKEQIKQDIGIVEEERKAVSQFIQEVGTDISESGIEKEQIIKNLKEDYKFYTGLIETYKFMINEIKTSKTKDGNPLDSSNEEKKLSDAQKNLHAIIKQLKELDVLKEERQKITSYSFETMGGK